MCTNRKGEQGSCCWGRGGCTQRNNRLCSWPALCMLGPTHPRSLCPLAAGGVGEASGQACGPGAARAGPAREPARRRMGWVASGGGGAYPYIGANPYIGRGGQTAPTPFPCTPPHAPSHPPRRRGRSQRSRPGSGAPRRGLRPEPRRRGRPSPPPCQTQPARELGGVQTPGWPAPGPQRSGASEPPALPPAHAPPPAPPPTLRRPPPSVFHVFQALRATASRRALSTRWFFRTCSGHSGGRGAGVSWRRRSVPRAESASLLWPSEAC